MRNEEGAENEIRSLISGHTKSSLLSVIVQLSDSWRELISRAQALVPERRVPSQGHRLEFQEEEVRELPTEGKTGEPFTTLRTARGKKAEENKLTDQSLLHLLINRKYRQQNTLGSSKFKANEECGNHQ